MIKLGLPEGNWAVLIAMFIASVSLAGLSSRWFAKIFPALERFGFLLFLSLTTGYFCIAATIMRGYL